MPQGDGGRVQEVGQLGAGAAPVADALRARSRRRGAAPQRAVLLLLLLLKVLLLTCLAHPNFSEIAFQSYMRDVGLQQHNDLAGNAAATAAQSAAACRQQIGKLHNVTQRSDTKAE